MSSYIKLATLEYPFFEGDIRLEHPEIGELFVCPNTYAEVKIGQLPEFDALTQTFYESKPYFDNDVWKTDILIKDFTKEELDNLNKNRKELSNKAISNEYLNINGTTPNVIK